MRSKRVETIEDVCRQKRHFMNVLKWARRLKNKKGIELYSGLVNDCDLQAKVLRTAMWMLTSAVILVSGCNLAREGIYGLGRCVGAVGEDVKWIAEKTADNITTKE